MMHSPFRFIPIAPYVYQPEWTHLTTQDHPFEDGFNGEFTLTITAQTPICVGGQQKPANEHSPGRVCFYKTPTGEYAIPGTSIKGMLRNVLKIASFGRMEQVEDQRLGVRDISKSDNFYTKAITQTTTYAGWLTFEKGQWQITPCDYARIHQEKIIKHFKINVDQWKSKLQSAESRYRKLGGLNTVQFTEPKGDQRNKKEAEALGSGERQGVLVVTGQPGADYTRRGGKKREFIFYNYESSETEKVSSDTVADFMQIHEESHEWKHWKPQVEQLRQQGLGVPVFFHRSPQGDIASMGLAYMYKLAYRNSIHDAVNNSSPDHLKENKWDLAELMFGRIDDDPTGEGNLRGRVGCGTAILTKPELPSSIQNSTVLSGPKPTFYPAYIEQPHADKAYKTLMDNDAKLAGWKRYPVKNSWELPELDFKVKQNKKVQVELETLPEGASFSCKIRFHNLKAVELGALLWVIDFDQNPVYRHNIGAGKPFGFGQILLEADNFVLQPNDITINEPTQVLVITSREAFKQRMQLLWQELSGQEDWIKSPQIANLLATANPATFNETQLEYPGAPKNFVKLKQDKDYLAPPDKAPNHRLNTDNLSEFKADLDELIAAGEIMLEKQQKAQALAEEKVRRQLEKSNMSDEDKLIAEAKDYLEPAEAYAKGDIEELSQTTLKKLEKALKDLSAIEFTDEQVSEVTDLAERTLALPMEKGRKIRDKNAKKLLNQISVC